MVRFSILGPVEVTVPDLQLPGLTPRQRAVLAYLLLHPRLVISADRLIDAVWGLTPPDTARAQVHAAVTAIRRVLRAGDAAELLETRAAGYVISPEPGQLDLDEFTRKITAAQTLASDGDPIAAAREIRAALELWRGEALADVKADYVTDGRARLEERRLTAVERLADLELSLGGHEDLIDELGALVAVHPLRERLAGQLMLALHRSGRQADALSVARALRTHLVRQEGLEPGQAFVGLEEAILRDDPKVRPEPAKAAPNFLPYDTPDFAGRAAEIKRLATSAQGDSLTIVTIDGMAGIGKTTLVVHVAHQLADRYTDGRLFIDLQGHTPGQAPAEPGVALERLLRQLGVPAERIPATLPDRAALWRSELANRSILAVLDNAADTQHVRHLLPGGSNSLILVTSRRRLTDLDGAYTLSMEPLPEADAANLFARIVGERAGTEPDAVLDVLRLCGFLPLAVRIAAARLRHRPRWTVEYLAGRLRDHRRRLGELATSERGVAAAFSLSYEHLDPEEQRVFRFAGLHPGRDFDAHAAAALTGLPLERAEFLLENLLDAHVLLQHEPGRYTFHDLVREHARTTALAEDPSQKRENALIGLFDHYLFTASRAVGCLYPYGWRERPSIPEPDTPEIDFPGSVQAGAWLHAERANLIAAGLHAADHGWCGHADALAAILRPYLNAHAHHTDAIILYTRTLNACRRARERAGEARALVDLGFAYWRQGRYEQAREFSQRALALCRELGDRHGETRADNTLGMVACHRRDYAAAHRHLHEALLVCREIGNRVGEGHVLANLGIALERQGQYDEARNYLSQSLNLHRALGNEAGEARVLDHLGLGYRNQCRFEEARDHHRRALRLYQKLGNRGDEASPLNGLGENACALGDPGQAVQHHGNALAVASELGLRPEEARAHAGLARAHRALGHADLAQQHAGDALTAYTELGLPEGEEIRYLQ